MKDYKDLSAFAILRGFTITSTVRGHHNPNSKHYKGLAIDVRTRDKTEAQVNDFIKEARSKGIRVIDERRRPDPKKVWSGAHLHLEL